MEKFLRRARARREIPNSIGAHRTLERRTSSKSRLTVSEVIVTSCIDYYL